MKLILISLLFLLPMRIHGAVIPVDSSFVQDGNWVLSKIVKDADGGFTTSAMEEKIGGTIECKYPPMNSTFDGYLLPYAVCRVIGTVGSHSTNTIELPALPTPAGSVTVGMKAEITDKFKAFSFKEKDGSTTTRLDYVVPLSGDVRSLIADLMSYMGHTRYRDYGRPAASEIHNSYFSDDFSTDPVARWVDQIGTLVWDGATFEADPVDSAGNELLLFYTANAPGSMSMESQVTGIIAVTSTRHPGAAVRCHNAGTSDGYVMWLQRTDTDDSYAVSVFLAGTRTKLTTVSYNETNDEFYTIRFAAEGVDGGNVSLYSWIKNEGTTKPSSPDWIGNSWNQDSSFIDTGVNRLDDSTVHLLGGMGARGSQVGDDQMDDWKVRTIRDRYPDDPTPVAGAKSSILRGGVFRGGKIW